MENHSSVTTDSETEFLVKRNSFYVKAFSHGVSQSVNTLTHSEILSVEL